MTPIKIPVDKIKNLRLRRVAIAITLLLAIAMRLAVTPIGFLIALIDSIWSCCEHITYTTRTAIDAWRRANPKNNIKDTP